MKFEPDSSYTKYQKKIAKLKALRDGVDALRNKTYLPQMAREENDSYSVRASQTILTNYTDKTATAAKGMIFRKPLSYDGLKLNDSDVDSEGQTLNRFAQDVAESGLWYGHSVIMVDAPSKEGVRTEADRKAAGLQPYFSLVERDSIISREYTYINGKAVLTEIVIAEEGDKIRRLFIGGGEMWVEMEDSGEYMLEKQWSNTLPYIPIATFYTRRTGVLESKPMFDNIADLNIRHLNLDSKMWMMTEHMVPQLVIYGQTVEMEEGRGNTQAVNTSFNFSDKESGGVEWLVYQGKEIEIIERQMGNIEQQIALMGLSMLSSKTESREMTASEKNIDTAQETADLASIAQNLEDALNEAYAIWCEMAGLTPGDETIGVNREFMSDLLSAEEMRELREQYAAGLMSKEYFWDCMERGGRFKSLDRDKMKAELEAEPPFVGE